MPAFELLDVARYNRLTVQASRGCPLRCEFCASSVLLTGGYKQKPVEKVLDEIDRIRELWRRPFIEFADDNAFVDKRYWKRLLPRLAERKIRWFAETDLSLHRDAELLEMLRASGCVEVLVGFESPVETGLHGLETRGDWKRKHWPECRKAIADIQAHGIRVNACFILGLDGHGPWIFDQVRQFVDETQPFDVQITIQTPFPGTPLHSRLGAEDRLESDGEWARCTLFDVNYRPTEISAEELRCGFRRLAELLYSEKATRQRRESFRRGEARP